MLVMKSLISQTFRLATCLRILQPALPLRSFTRILPDKDYIPKKENIAKPGRTEKHKKKHKDDTTTTTTTTTDSESSTTSLWESDEEIIPETPKSLEDYVYAFLFPCHHKKIVHG